MAIGIKANKFSILYIVNKRHDITEHKNASNKYCTNKNICKNGCKIPISKIT
jgi:hypothetical protein